jgi:hypothetical protein
LLFIPKICKAERTEGVFAYRSLMVSESVPFLKRRVSLPGRALHIPCRFFFQLLMDKS